MKNFFYIIATIALMATLNSCTADEIETAKPQAEVQADGDVDPNNPGSIIPPKK
jgi:hypothetical protein